MIDTSDKRIIEAIHNQIENEISRFGIFCRVFSRVKRKESIESKISKKNYSELNKMQDLFGIRVITYFIDDFDIVGKILERIYDQYLPSTNIDDPKGNEFGVVRRNYIFSLPQELASSSNTLRRERLAIDNTFEVQVRTILSEGWHEVEHDLRYKRKEDWGGHNDLSRSLNGIMATLEVCDWTMSKLFDELAYRHYKSKSWDAMVMAKFRLRWVGGSISKEIIDILNDSKSISKQLFVSDRAKLMSNLIANNADLPISRDNIIFITNHYLIHDPDLAQITPKPLIDELG